MDNTSGSAGINTTSPAKTLHVLGSFNATTPDNAKSIAMNASCVIITGSTSELAIC